MRKLICLSIFLLIGITSFSQELELCGSFGTSSEIRFQDAFGIGLQYQHDIGKKFKVGFGTNYYNKNSNFTEQYQPLWGLNDPYGHWVTKYDAESKRFSLRLNIQRILRDNEYLTISLGPELSYNFLWGHEDNSTWSGGPDSNSFSRYIDFVKKFGLGLISKVEIKDIITPRLSLCLVFRPEIMFKNKNDPHAGTTSLFSPALAFAEFQIGLKYRFKDPL